MNAHVPDEELKIPEIQPGIYKHYKGNIYEVVGVSLDTETHEPFVVYKPVHDSKVMYWTRPYDMFVESVEIDGVSMPRFAYMGATK